MLKYNKKKMQKACRRIDISRKLKGDVIKPPQDEKIIILIEVMLKNKKKNCKRPVDLQIQAENKRVTR